MEATYMIESIERLRTQAARPATPMQIIRSALQAQIAQLDTAPMPPIFDDGQRRVFLAELDKLEAFLKSEDGADAVELLVRTFREFQVTPEPVPVEAEHAADPQQVEESVPLERAA